MQDFINKKIVLGICGGIAAYKAAFLLRELTRLGAQVRVVMTQSAQAFITPMTLQALSGESVRCDIFDEQAERAMGHIELARWADYLLIAPASANTLAKMAHGIADDLLTTMYLVAEKIPVVVCPAMNRSMWLHPATQTNCAILETRGVVLIGPDEGAQACGEFGTGRLSDVDDIIDGLRLYDVHNKLTGHRVLITAGPTREAIDPVRYITNASSGKMGYALAKAAKMAGADVTLISGPTALPPLNGVDCYAVQTAQEMMDSVQHRLQAGMLFIGTAAVADYTIKNPHQHKIKKSDTANWQLNLVANPDILAHVAACGLARYVVGFAAETKDVIHHAKSKLVAKQLDMIIANQVGPGLGFDEEVNQVVVLTKQTQLALALNHKTRIAGQIIAILALNLQNDRS